MQRTIWWIGVAVAALGAACTRESMERPFGPIAADVLTCTDTGEEPEIIGRQIYNHSGAIAAGEYDISGFAAGMSYLPDAITAKSRWGGLTTQNTNSASQVEQHDVDGNGATDGGCEQHLVDNGELLLVITGSGATFFRNLALLDTRGILGHVPGSGVYNDTHIPLDLDSSVATSLSGWFGVSTSYQTVAGGGSGLGSYGTADLGVHSGDSTWWVSTYLPGSSGGSSRPWFDHFWGILNSFNFDYSGSGTFGPAWNSMGVDSVVSNEVPMLHVFETPIGVNETFVVRMRAILPFHRGSEPNPNHGILVSQTLNVTAQGDTACFSRSGAPDTLVSTDAACTQHSNKYRYQWSFDGSGGGWSTNLTSSHKFLYPYGGTGTARLRVQASSGSGPIDSTEQSFTIDPMRIAILGQTGGIDTSGVYTWSGLASGVPVKFGGWTKSWYYDPWNGPEVLVGTSFSYSRTVTISDGAFTLRLHLVNGADVRDRIINVCGC